MVISNLEFQGFDELNAVLADAYTPMMNALWHVMATGDEWWAEEHTRCEQQVYELLSSTEIQAFLNRRERLPAGGQDARQITLLRNELLEHQGQANEQHHLLELWNKLHYRIATHRASLEGKLFSNVELTALLQTEREQEPRERIWEAGMQLGGKLAPDLLNLVKLRNQVAVNQGYDNYFVMKLAAQEVTLAQLNHCIDSIKSGLDQTYRSLKEELDEGISESFGIEPGQLRPWHYNTLMLQGYPAPSTAGVWEPSVILPKLADWLALRGVKTDFLTKADLLGRMGKSQANCCLNINRGQDIRVMCSLSKDWRGLQVLLHETGHALYEQGLDPSLPFLLRQPAHTFLSEATALLFERLTVDPEWLGEMGFVMPDQCNGERKNWLRKHLLMKLYATLAVVEFEKELYHNPDGRLNEQWWDIVGNTQLIHRPDRWDYPYWAAKEHLTTLPVYYYNYLWGEVAASQIQHALFFKYGAVANQASLDWLDDKLFKPGASAGWQELLRACTGAPMDTSCLIDELKSD
ncbi:M3 family metallopeptidase [Paenibacillus tarimensis]|uniref:M3 family metallopeptidase n=1 Tax=Paenibacillus tarimensis TaxID=416012 RepID=UPI001F46B909|nr:M3 family metallopeptidase [Paenibacillus tarimensis]MCF2945628.1 M3 family metallopeptidase [Paenibacillus tarimensis]